MEDAPLFFKLIYLKNTILPKTPALQFANKVLQMDSLDFQFADQEDDNESENTAVTEEDPAMEVTNEDSTVEDSVMEVTNEIVLDEEYSDIEETNPDFDENTFFVDRYDIVNSLFRIYSENDSIGERTFTLRYKKETGVGEGVTKDVYTTFFTEIAQMHSAGLYETIPSSLTEEEAFLFGKIICHAYQTYRVFPFLLAKSFFEMLLFDQIRDEVLITSFTNFLMKNEREILLKALRGNDLTDSESNEIWVALGESNIRAKPKAENIRPLVLKAAKCEFVQKPFFILKSIQRSLKNVWSFESPDDMDAFYATSKPTVENTLEYFRFDVKHPTEERIQSYFERYVRSCDIAKLCLLVQFCTGSSSIGNGSVCVNFVNQEKTLKFRSKSCFKIFYVPRQIENIKQFNVLMGDIENGNSEVWEMHD